MPLKLTPEVLRAGYDLLTTTEPFKRWNLPEGEDVLFRVVKQRGYSAQLITGIGPKPIIEISEATNGHIDTVLSSLAHEMIHLHEVRCKIRSRGVNHHGAAFRKWANQVCRAHGFDVKLFY